MTPAPFYAHEPARPGIWQPCWSLCRREIVRFLRQRSRVIGALGTPLVFWLIAGLGLSRSFRLPGIDANVSYLEYTFPGAIAAVLLFTAIFSMISIIDDRAAGFMQGVMASPAPRVSIVLGKVLGATTLAVGQAALMLLLAPVAGIPLSAASFFVSLGAMYLIAIAMTSLGFAFAWPMSSTQGFHAVMNLLLMPMLILSGAFFPAGGSASVIRWIMYANPMTYCVSLLRRAMYLAHDDAGHLVGGSIGVDLTVVVAFAALMIAISARLATRDTV